jgi:hypothetical protein
LPKRTSASGKEVGSLYHAEEDRPATRRRYPTPQQRQKKKVRKKQHKLIKGQNSLMAFGFKKLRAVPRSLIVQEAIKMDFSGSYVSTTP